jgi:branched-chain amino acid transport system ATP-binding protein
MSPALLEVEGLIAGYGAMEVVHGVDLRVEAGELVVVLGRNGAGKTTALRAVAGLRDGVFGGSVRLDGAPLERLRPAEVAGRGLVLVPEGRHVFPTMTVEENLRVGAYTRRRQGGRSLAEAFARVHELFPVLSTCAAKPCGALSGGEQQMVAIGRALMASPRVLLLDEPTAGLAPYLAEELYAALRRLAADGVGLAVVEQSVERALEHGTRAYVIDDGRVVREGACQELRAAEVAATIVEGVGGVARG